MQCDKINCSIKDLCTSHQILLMCVIDLPNQLRKLKPIKTFLEAITRAARLLHGPPASHIKGLWCFNPWWLLCWGSWWDAVSLLLTKAGYSDSSMSLFRVPSWAGPSLKSFFFACCLFELRSISSSYLSAARKWKVVFCCYISCFWN